MSDPGRSSTSNEWGPILFRLHNGPKWESDLSAVKALIAERDLLQLMLEVIARRRDSLPNWAKEMLAPFVRLGVQGAARRGGSLYPQDLQ